MSRYRLEVTGDWAGAVTTHGWRPAIAGTVNQTGESDEEASVFGSREEARAVYETVILPELPEDDARNWAPRFRIAALDANGDSVAYEVL